LNQKKKKGEEETGKQYMAWARVERAISAGTMSLHAFDADARRGLPNLTFLIYAPV
jgi:hypothetical protein